MLKAKHGFSFVVAAISVLLLVACGDDNSTKASDKIVVDSVEDLSNCVATKVGNLEYVDTVAYVCVELGDKIKWVQVAGVGDNSEDFRACTGKKDELYSFSQKENTLYVCNDEEWVPVKQLDDNDRMEESSSSEAKSSSSSVTQQSSSSKKVESSSSKVTEPVEPAEVTTGTMTDSRDGQTYKTVTIGTQTWMAENLNYETVDSYCCNDNESNCTTYGRLYTWAAAMDSVGTWSTNGKGCGFGKTCTPTYPVRGVCPEGWHLPIEAEFETLVAAVGGKSTAGKMLKSTSGWNSSCNGTDAFAFSALPAGNRDIYGRYLNEGYGANFWSSTENNSNYAYYMALYCSRDVAGLNGNYKSLGFSVRCVKD